MSYSTFYIKRYEHTYEIRHENGPLVFCFSRSLEVIGTGTDQWATCDLLLVIHSKHESTSYRFRDKLSKFTNFPIPLVLNAPATW